MAHPRDSPSRSPRTRWAWWQGGSPRPTGGRGVRCSPGRGLAAAVMLGHPFAAPPPQVPWARCHRLPPCQPWAGICPDASLQTCCGRCQPRLLALPHWWEEEEEEVAADRRRLSKERDTSGDVVQAGRDRTGGLDCAHHQLRGDSSSMPGKLRRRGRGLLQEKRWQSLEERGTQMGHPVLARSKTCDPSFCKETEQTVAAAEGQPSPSLSKRAVSYHKAFGELAEREKLLACFPCAWQREVPYHGRLYISSRHVCFHSTLLLKDIKAVVPVASISALKKTNTALLVPNALSIRTADGEKFLFVSLRQREATYQLLKSVCKHLQDNGWNPLDCPSTEEILRKPLTSSQSDLEQSTLEPDSLQELPDGPSPMPRQAEEEDEEVAAAAALSSGGPHTTLWTQTIAQLSPLNTIILIYLLLMVALLLSSGYISVRIVDLEQQLASVGAWPDLHPSHQYKKT